MRKTTAAKTPFVRRDVNVAGWLLYVDGNAKITARNGSFTAPQANAFSLVEIDDCPFATPSCKAACYVHGLKKHAPEVHALYQANSTRIRQILDSADALDTAHEFGDWIARNVVDFRWHVSGDIFSMRYAYWIYHAVLRSPGVRHWIYTRSFEYARPLLRLPNIAVNFSVDRDNYRAAMTWRNKFSADPAYRTPRLCYLTVDGTVPELPTDSVIFPDYSLRLQPGEKPSDSEWWRGLTSTQKKMICPPDFRGKSAKRRCGPCDRCMK